MANEERKQSVTVAHNNVRTVLTEAILRVPKGPGAEDTKQYLRDTKNLFDQKAVKASVKRGDLGWQS
jgi:hypothetical protein